MKGNRIKFYIKIKGTISIWLIVLFTPLTAFIPCNSADNWITTDLGLPYNTSVAYGLTGVSVGDGNNDNRTEVYFCSGDNGCVYEYYSEGNKLLNVSIGKISDAKIFWGGKVVVGDGDSDGKNEVYVSGYYKNSSDDNWNFTLCQFKFDGTDWIETQIDSVGFSRDLCIGDGENNGKNELFSGDGDGNIYEYTKKGNTWTKQSIGHAPLFKNGVDWYTPQPQGICIGDGDNDGSSEIYAATTDNHIYMFKYHNLSWNITDIGAGDNETAGPLIGMTSVIISDADLDSKNEVYSFSSINGTVFRFKWNATSGLWERSNLALYGDLTAVDLCTGIGNVDGNNKIYASTISGQVYEISYDNTTNAWHSNGIGSGKDKMNSIDIGTLYNDSTNAIYGACADGHAYEFFNDNIPPANPIVSSDTHPVPGKWYPKNIVHVMWLDQGTDRSGIDGYSYIWDTNATTIPPAVIDCEESVHDTNSSVLPDGDNYYFHIRACDNVGNWNISSTHFGPIRIDTTPPDSLNIEINGGANYSNSADVKLYPKAHDPTPGSGLWEMSFSNDGFTWSNWTDWADNLQWSLTNGSGGIDKDGNKSVYFRVEDLAGNIGGPVSASIFLDRKTPGNLSIIINDGAQYTNSGIVSLAISATDPEPGSSISQMTLANEESSFGSWESFSTTKSGWSLINGTGGTDTDGQKTVFLKVSDNAGNIGGPVNGTIFLDRVKPALLGILINDGAVYTNNPKVNLTLSATDSYPSSGLWMMQFSDDGTRWTIWEPFANNKIYNLSPPDGQKTIWFRVEDHAGNIADIVNASVILDTTPPIISDVMVTGITDKSAVISWSTNEDANSGLDYWITTTLISSFFNSSYVSYHSILLKDLSPSTVYHFRVYSRDRAGNPSNFSSNYTFITSAIPDTTPPMISKVQILTVTDRLAVIAWITNEPADSIIDYGTSVSYNQKISDHQFVLIHSLTITGLSPSTAYHFRVGSKDPSGNGPSFSTDYTFSTLATRDLTPPIISNVKVIGITDHLAIITWETNEAADSTIEYGNTNAYGKIVQVNLLVILHEITLSNLSPSTTYHFRAESTDVSGNGPSTSDDFTFQTNALPDTIPPQILNIQIQGVTDTSATVTWETDEISDSFVNLGLTPSYGISAEDSSFTIIHSIFLQNLTSNKVYHLQIRSTDPSGNTASSGDYTFRTLRIGAGPDTTPPVISGVQVLGITNTRAVILWQTDELADSEVEYGTNTTYGLRATDPAYVLTHSIVLESLLSSTEYHLVVMSTDVFGNGPTTTADFKFTTSAGPDLSTPIISEIQVTNITNTSALISWHTDKPSNSIVEYGLDANYGNKLTSQIFILNHSIKLTRLMPGNTYHFRVISVDSAGNAGLPSADGDFTTLKHYVPPGQNQNPNTVTVENAGLNWLWLGLVIVIIAGIFIIYIYSRRS